MKKKKVNKRKKRMHIILCCEILLIATLVAGVGFYVYSVRKQGMNTAAGKEKQNAAGAGPEKQDGTAGSKIDSELAGKGKDALPGSEEETVSGQETESEEESSEAKEVPQYTYDQGIQWFEPKTEGKVVLAFAGDILFDDSYAVMVSINQREGKIYDSISPDLLEEMTGADIFMLNNEFTYTTRGEPTPEKAFTFRAAPETSAYLKDMGVDIVSLANNHTYDYGEISLLDSIDTLTEIEMPYVGAGRDIEEASRPFFFETHGMKIGFLSATQIERLENPDTKGATADRPGVFRCWDGTRLYEKTKETAEACDFLVVYVHWGSENTAELDWAQKDQALKLAQSGADLIIGTHSHCLQGMDVVEGVPVFYSVGNFLFSSKTLDTCLIKAEIEDGKISRLQFVPAIQQNCRTQMLTGSEKTRVIDYMQSLSEKVAIDSEGYITY